jgi:ABC-type amino acid transport substrate-binding protein
MPFTPAYVVCLVACLSLVAHARVLNVCVSDRPVAPYSYPDHDGVAQQLIRAAIERQGDTVRFEVAPVKRCFEIAQSGGYDAIALATVNDLTQSFLAFPTISGKPDSLHGFGLFRLVMVRRKDASITWDGQRLSGNYASILFPSGLALAEAKLKAINAGGMAQAKTAEQLLHMLTLGRADAAIIRDLDADELLAKREYAAALEKMPSDFAASELYFAFTRTFQRSAPAYTKAVWGEIGRMQAAQRPQTTNLPSPK